MGIRFGRDAVGEGESDVEDVHLQTAVEKRDVASERLVFVHNDRLGVRGSELGNEERQQIPLVIGSHGFEGLSVHAEP